MTISDYFLYGIFIFWHDCSKALDLCCADIFLCQSLSYNVFEYRSSNDIGIQWQCSCWSCVYSCFFWSSPVIVVYIFNQLPSTPTASLHSCGSEYHWFLVLLGIPTLYIYLLSSNVCSSSPSWWHISASSHLLLYKSKLPINSIYTCNGVCVHLEISSCEKRISVKVYTCIDECTDLWPKL